MSRFNIERAVNNEFYGTFQGGNNEQVWKTPDTYKNKGDVVNAIRVVAIFFNFFVFQFIDNTGASPVIKEAIVDGGGVLKVTKIMTIKKEKNAKSR